MERPKQNVIEKYQEEWRDKPEVELDWQERRSQKQRARRWQKQERTLPTAGGQASQRDKSGRAN